LEELQHREQLLRNLRLLSAREPDREKKQGEFNIDNYPHLLMAQST
jgi:hypothetical protein